MARENNRNGDYRHKPVVAPVNQAEVSNGTHASQRRASDEATVDFSAIWEAIRRGKWVILLTVLLFVGVAVVYNRVVDPVYEASSMVALRAGGGVSAVSAAPTGVRTLSSEVGVLNNSVQLAVQVVNRLEEAASALGTNEHYPLLNAEGEKLSTQEKADLLMERVSFEAYGEQNMVSIIAESTVPEEAASIANFYAEEYEAYSQKQARESVAASRAFLEEQARKRENELDSLNSRLTAFARAREVPKQGPAGEQVVAEYRNYQQRRDQAMFDLRQARSDLELLQQQLEQAEPGLEAQVSEEQEVKTLQSRIDAVNQKLGQLEAQAETYYMNYPEARNNGRVDTTIAELAEIERQMNHLRERKDELTGQLAEASRNATGSSGGGSAVGYVATLRSRIDETKQNIQRLEAQVEQYDQRIASYEGRLQSIPTQKVERDQLERQIAQAEEWYNEIVAQLQGIRVQEEAEQGYVNVVRSALVPDTPVYPKVKQNIILALLLGLGFGIGIAFIRRATDNRLERPEDLEARGYELMGVIPAMNNQIKSSFEGREAIEVEGRERSTSLMTLLDPWSFVSENFRLIRTNIRHAQRNGPIRTLLVTSPEVADGKSVAAVNLAIAMAQDGRRTLLVDADLRRPSGHSLLGVARTPGLPEIITKQVDFNPEDYITDIDNFSFIPAGTIDAPPTELLDSASMQDFLDTLRPLYDAIILDSPPVLAATDAVVLATQCDASVIVASADKTRFQALEQTQKKLGAVGAHVMGTIVNRFDPSKTHQDYGYGYGYYDPYVAQEE